MYSNTTIVLGYYMCDLHDPIKGVHIASCHVTNMIIMTIARTFLRSHRKFHKGQLTNTHWYRRPTQESGRQTSSKMLIAYPGVVVDDNERKFTLFAYLDAYVCIVYVDNVKRINAWNTTALSFTQCFNKASFMSALEYAHTHN